MFFIEFGFQAKIADFLYGLWCGRGSFFFFFLSLLVGSHVFTETPPSVYEAALSSMGPRTAQLVLTGTTLFLVLSPSL